MCARVTVLWTCQAQADPGFLVMCSNLAVTLEAAHRLRKIKRRAEVLSDLLADTEGVVTLSLDTEKIST